MKVGAFGEVMLRLTPPEYRLLEQGRTLCMDFTGTGVSILANLAHFGLKTWMMTHLPKNRLGDAAEASLKQMGMSTDFVGHSHNHIGSYFAENGFGARPTYVTYQNRRDSSFGISGPDTYPIETFLDTVDMVHICGISLGLTQDTWRSAKYIAQKAYEKNKTVCFDFNFRPSLNTEQGKGSLMKERYEEILPYCDIVFGSLRDLTDLLKLAPAESVVSEEDTLKLIRDFLKANDIKWFAGTDRLRQKDGQYITGRIVTLREDIKTMPRHLTVLDRIGAGDAYAAGVLLGYCEKWSLERSADFAVTNAVLAHTIAGDVPLTSREQVQHVLDHPTIDIIR